MTTKWGSAESEPIKPELYECIAKGLMLIKPLGIEAWHDAIAIHSHLEDYQIDKMIELGWDYDASFNGWIFDLS